MGTTNTIELVLNVTPDTPVGWLAKAKAVGSSTAANASLFSGIASVLATLATATTALDTAQAAAADKGKTAVQARNASCAVVKKTLRATRSAVQGLCDDAPDAPHAAAIAAASSLGVRAKAVRTKAPFAGTALGNGVVKLAVKVPGKKGARVYYEWRMSTDGWKTCVSLPGTNVSFTIVQGLTPATEVQFESRTTMKSIATAWSLAIPVLVQ